MLFAKVDIYQLLDALSTVTYRAAESALGRAGVVYWAVCVIRIGRAMRARGARLWRRFRPRQRGALTDPTAYEQATLYVQARQIVDEMMRRTRSLVRGRHSQLARATKAAKLLQDRTVYDAPHLLALLILKTPGAVRAQIEVDRHHGGYSNHQARLYELIDFNDTFVNLVLALRVEDRPEFVERMRHEMSIFCASVGQPMFSEGQLAAIVHGLGREIAVFNGARRLGYAVRMTSRTQDAMGVDMIISDPHSKKSIGVDVKTTSSYHWRLMTLERQKRINQQQRLACERVGYCQIRRPPRAPDAPDTMLLRISTEQLGGITNFEFEDLAAFGRLLATALEQHGRYVV